MMIVIIIFAISLLIAFYMLFVRAWEIRTHRVIVQDNDDGKPIIDLPWKRVEKIILYMTKHAVQWIVLTSVKTWYTVITKVKILFKNKLPKINNLFKRSLQKNDNPRKISFVHRAVVESKIKIKKIKENIIKEHHEELHSDNSEVEKNI